MARTVLLTLSLFFTYGFGLTESDTTPIPIRCEAPSVMRGKPTAVTCYFNIDIQQTKSEIVVQHYPTDGDFTEIFYCSWAVADSPDCRHDQNFSYSGLENNTLILTIPSAREGYEGRYVCQVIPSHPDDTIPCNFTLTESGENPLSEANNNIPVVVGILVPAVLIICAVVIVFYFRKRLMAWFHKKTGREFSTEGSDQEKETIPFTRQFLGRLVKGQGKVTEGGDSLIETSEINTNVRECAVSYQAEGKHMDDQEEKSCNSNVSSTPTTCVTVWPDLQETRPALKTDDVETVVTGPLHTDTKEKLTNTKIELYESEPTVFAVNDTMATEKTSPRENITHTSLLHSPCQRGDLDAVKSLLQKGTDLEERDEEDCTPLHLACLAGNKDIVQELLNCRANIDAKDKKGLTPLHMACRAGSNSVVKMLLSAGANADVTSHDSSTPLHLACRGSRTEIVQMLLTTGAKTETKDISGFTPLHLSCQAGDQQIVQKLLHHGAKGDAQDNVGQTPIHVACQTERANMVQLLLHNGVQTNVKDHSGITPLHLACRCRTADIFLMLLDKGVDIHATDNAGQTPLHVACQAGNKKIVQKLADLGADLAAQTKDRFTPVYIAHQNRHDEIVNIITARYRRTIRDTETGKNETLIC